ncbi:MAG: RpiB/LacA/LacB family sugar-phosphate isomerase [Candidatus Paceibacterota bacterium]
MIIYLGADHRGFKLKKILKTYLKENGYKVVDFGNDHYDESDDYPDFILPVAKKVAENPEQNRGIVLGGSGQGEAMIANRIKGVRAAVYYGPSAFAKASAGKEEIIKLSREHNDANILSLGASFLEEEQARQAVKIWLEIPFSKEERHIRRIKKIDSL